MITKDRLADRLLTSMFVGAVVSAGLGLVVSCAICRRKIGGLVTEPLKDSLYYLVLGVTFVALIVALTLAVLLAVKYL